MFRLYANKNRLLLKEKEPVTSGSINVYTVQFEFSPDWDSLDRVAVFRSCSKSISIPLNNTIECSIPWEVLEKHPGPLYAGVYGTKGDEVVLPTQWAYLGPILEGTVLGDNSQPPEPNMWVQELKTKGDALDYDGETLSLMSGEDPLSSVKISGVRDHSLLTGRDSLDQHPIDAITGLKVAVASIPVPMTADQLRKILNGV